jgi:hypothetical protein
LCHFDFHTLRNMDRASFPPQNSTASDPFDLQQISGFYGPGAWAAFLLAVLSSWYSIRYRLRKISILTVISPILYINWAAIDLLRQSSKHNVSPGPTVATVAVTYWGLWYLNLQCRYVVQAELNNLSDSHSLSGAHRATKVLFHLGGVLPTIALAMCVHRVDVAVAAFTAKHSGITLHADFTKALAKVRWWDYVTIVSTVISLVATPASVVTTVMFTNTRFLLCLVVHITSVSVTVWLLAGPYALLLAWAPSHTSISCFIKPCAPQSMGEWDQAFALLCGVVVFVYEVGPDVWMLGRKLAVDCA